MTKPTVKSKRGPGRPILSNKVKGARRRETAGIARAALERLGVDAAGLAERVGTDVLTVRAWLAGRKIMSNLARTAVEALRRTS